jgi:hypothetical protein
VLTQVISIDPVYQQPIRLDMAIPVMRPVATQGVVLAAGRERDTGSQQQDRLAHLARVVATLLGELHVAPELGHADHVAHGVSDS